MTLNKRIKRDFKENIVRNSAMIMIIALSMSLITALCSATDSILYTVGREWRSCRVEDGSFETYMPLSERNFKDLSELNVGIEKMFYSDVETESGSVIRIFGNRRAIDLPYAETGHLPREDSEIFLEKLYADSHRLTVGDRIELGGEMFEICGTGCLPDYNYVKQSTADVAANEEFGVAIVTADTFAGISRGRKTVYNYAYVLGEGCTARDLKKKLIGLKFDISSVKDTYIKEQLNWAMLPRDTFNSAADRLRQGAAALADGADMLKKGLAGTEAERGLAELADGAASLYGGIDRMKNEFSEYLSENAEVDAALLSSFQEAKYNIRINGVTDDSKIGKQSALVVGVFLLILLVYMLSVFASGTVERERAVIGTLYALGYSKREVLSHYMKIPLIVSASGAVLGAVCGFLLTDAMAESYSSMYSFPKLTHVYPLYLCAYAVGMPTLLAYVINRRVLSSKLGETPLAMIRGAARGTGGIDLRLGGLSFPMKYRIRQFFRELKGNLTLFAGLVVSVMLIMFSVACYGSISEYINGIADDVNCEYTYILRNPVSDLPKNPTVGYTRGFFIDYPLTGGEMEVTLTGVAHDNPYFDFADGLTEDCDKIYMSSAVRIKFGYHTGDRVVLCDRAEDKLYAFEIADEVKYGNGLYFFMNIDAMRHAFGLPYFDKDELKKGERIPKTESFYYNTVFSDRRLEFRHNMLLSEISKSDMQKGADRFMVLMWDMILMMIAVSVIIFVAVMYLLMKLEIDRSGYSISLLKALGYSEREVNAFYLDSSLIVTAAAIVIGMPFCRLVVGWAYPFCVSNVNAGFAVSVSPVQYLIIAAIVLVSYFLTRAMLVRYLKKIDLSAVLKNRE